MAAENHGWTISDTGCGNGPAGDDDHKPGGQIDFMPTLEGGTLNALQGARDNVPWQYDFGKQIDFSGAPGRVDVPTGLEQYGVPNPQAGDPGSPIDFNAVAPEKDGQDYDLDGSGAPEASDVSAAAPGAPSH